MSGLSAVEGGAPLRRTPLHAEHVRLGAKLVPFAGWEMPIQYPTGIQAEHRAVREAAGLFDVSHMGEVWVSGPDALALVQRLTVNDASVLEPGRAQYSAFCREDGGVVDDLIVYRVPPGDRYLLVVNASNHARDVEWIDRHLGDLDAIVEDRSDDTALLALQGPRAERILAPLTDLDLSSLGSSRIAPATVAGAGALVARTGYTGEDGFEIFLDPDDAVEVWGRILDAGRPQGLVPIGLGARDSLRLEVGYPLHGHELDEEHTALESGIGWIVKLGKGDFLGRDALARQKAEGVERRLAGIVLEETGFPRAGYPVVHEGREVGVVTSGTVSPSLGKGVALGFVPTSLAEPGTRLGIRIRGRDVVGTVQRPPFYVQGSRRR